MRDGVRAPPVSSTLWRPQSSRGIDIPKGVVEGLNVAMREDARSAANLNPQRFSEKQKIDVNSMVTQPQTVTIVNDLKE